MLSTLKSNVLSDQARSGIAILNFHPLPTWIIEPHSFAIVFANKAATDCYGYTAEEFSDFNLLNLFFEESRIRFFQQATNSGITSCNGEYQHCRKDGKVIIADLYTSSVAMDDATFYQVTIVDVTEKTLLSKNLDEERSRYKTYIEQSSEGIFCQEFKVPFYIHDSFEHFIEHSKKTSHISYCNDSLAQMYGYTAANEMKGMLSHQLLDYSDASNIDYLRKFVADGFRAVNAESHEKDRYGNTRYFLNNAIGIVEDGYLKRIWGTQRDITEKRKIEEKLRLLANLVEETSDMLTAADLDFKAISWNKAAEKIYGLTADQVIGKNPGEFINIRYNNTSRDEVRNIITREGEWRGEVCFVRPGDNKPVTIFANFKLLRDENGKPIGHLISGSDITERKEAELKLKESENRFRDVADSAPVMIWMSDAENQTGYVNKTWEDFTGINLHEFTALGWHAIVHYDDLELAVEEYNKAFEKREVFNQVYRLRHHSGEYRWILETCIPRFFEDGTFVGYIGSSVDITEQKRVEEQLRHNATILENVADIIVTTDLKFKVKGWNKAAEKYHGISEAQAVGKKMPQLVNFTYYGTTQEQGLIDLQKNGIWNGEISFPDTKGKTKYFLYTIKYIYDSKGSKIGILMIGRNISDRKLIEKQLLKSEQFYRTLIADSLTGTALVDAGGKVTFVSPSVKNILGFEPEEFVGKTAFEFIHPDDFQRAFESFEKVVQNPHSKFIVIRLLHRNGEWVWCMVRGHNLLHNPNLNSLVLYFHDDTLRKQAEDALKKSEATFRNLISDLQIGVVLFDKTGKTILCNDAFAEIFGMRMEELIGNGMQSLAIDPIREDGCKFNPEERPIYKAVHSKEPAKDLVMGFYTPGRKGRIWILINGNPILNEQGEIVHIISSVKDITDRKKMEEEMVAKQINHQKQLTQASIDGQENERKEIGKELHDNIGQQLTTIKLLLDLAKTSAADESTNKMVSNALKSVSNVINDVRAMSRSLIPSTLKDLGLVESIYELVDSIARTQALQIEFVHGGFKEDKLQENQKLTMFRIIQEQLNNIVKHAGAKNAKVELSYTPGYIVLRIEDNGKGFDKKKFRTGVGFMNIKNRAELFGGQIEITAHPGNGCQLEVNFPIAGLH